MVLQFDLIKKAVFSLEFSLFNDDDTPFLIDTNNDYIIVFQNKIDKEDKIVFSNDDNSGVFEVLDNKIKFEITGADTDKFNNGNGYDAQMFIKRDDNYYYFAGFEINAKKNILL